MSDLALSYNPTRSRYEAHAHGELVAVVDVVLRDGVAELPHTFVEPAHRGGGVAAQIVGFALADLAGQAQPIRPLCPYIVSYLHRHPPAPGQPDAGAAR